MVASRCKRWLLVVGLLGCWGCGQPAAPPATATGSAWAGGLQESWDAVYIAGQKAGSIHTLPQPDDSLGQPAVRIEQHSRFTVQRFQQATHVEQIFVSWETPSGQLLRFQAEDHIGPSITHTVGIVEGPVLRLAITNGGRTDRRDLPWSAENGGFVAVEESLARQPLQPGEQRTVRALIPTFNVVAEVKLSARDYETTPLLSGSARLLRVDQQIGLPGSPPLLATCWTDEQGVIIKSRAEAMQQEAFRVSKEEALSQDLDHLPDLGAATFVPLAKPLAKGQQSQEILYRVEYADGDPAKLFISSPTQDVRSTGPHTAEITVRARRLPSPGSGDPPLEGSDPAPIDADRQPSSYVQSDDPRVRALANEAVGQETNPQVMARQLERFVHDKIEDKNFSQVFASAADVAQSLEGDCTEHAVLLAALARAKGIPARGVIGLEYVSHPKPAFGYHMWTEVYLDGHWYPLDGTLGRGGIGAAHLALARSSLTGDSAFQDFVALAQLLGRLKITVLSER